MFFGLSVFSPVSLACSNDGVVVGRDFHPDQGLWTKMPVALQAAFSMPTPQRDPLLRGRVELVIGRLGAGKTTWSALRATRLARLTDRQLATTGLDWPDPWVSITSFDALEDLRDSVLVWDEVHLMLPSSKGLLTRDHERFLIKFLSLARKRGNCIIGTTQAWTRVATHYRQLVTCVWIAQPIRPRRLHQAIGFDPPEDGGRQIVTSQWFGPAAARIPTNAAVWTGHAFDDGRAPATAAQAVAPIPSTDDVDVSDLVPVTRRQWEPRTA